MRKTDCEINTWLAEWMRDNYEWVVNAIADCEEDFSIADIAFSANTDGNLRGEIAEVKSIKGGWPFKYGEEWNPYFDGSNKGGIKKKMIITNPETAEAIRQHHIYIINAETKNHNTEESKINKILTQRASLIYIAADGLIFFPPKVLANSILGYAEYWNKSHTEEFGAPRKKSLEKKAIINLDNGIYKKVDVPTELLEK